MDGRAGLMIRIGPLSAEQRRALVVLRRQAVGRVAMRAQMVLLSAKGYSVAQIAAMFDLGEDRVRHWLRRYREAGPDGLADRPRPGRPPKERLARQIVDAQAGNPPCANGLVQGCWTVGLLAAFLRGRFRLHLSPSSVRRHLRAAGWRWGRPRLAPATHAPGRQRKADPAAAAKLALIGRALASAATVLYLDECELQLLPVIRACWMKGPRPRVPTPGRNARRAIFGALNARTGRLDRLIRPRKRAVDFVAFLEHLARAYPAGEVVLVLDNVVTHDAKLVRQWLAAHPRFGALWLPKYTAHEHNPIERVWGLLKDAVAANRLHGSIDTLVAHAERYLSETHFCAPQPADRATPPAALAA
jgi:transposase